jgi:glycosyltransferase involved in cell wall biosynthesis
MRGGIATFAETICADPRLAANFDMRLLNTARTATREGGSFNFDNLRFAIEDAWNVFRAARKADIIHLQLVADPGLPSLRAAALLMAGSLGRAQLIAHMHSAVGNAGRPELAHYGARDRFALGALRRANLICTVSNPGTATFRQFAGDVPVVTVDNAVNIADFTPGPGSETTPTVLFVGVICKRKGTLELARAAGLVRQRGVTDWNLVVVGGQGPTPQDEYDEIVAEFAKAGLSDSLVGPEWGEQVAKRLTAADVFVLPSFLEGQPIAILEAMASGLPIIGTTIGAVPDVVRDGIEGRVLEPGDVEGLAGALEQLVSDPPLRKRMALAARSRAEKFHSLDRLAARMTELYTAVLTVDRDKIKTSAMAEEQVT